MSAYMVRALGLSLFIPLIVPVQTRQTVPGVAGAHLRNASVSRVLMLHRQKIVDRVAREPGLVVIFLESVCDDPAIIAANIALKVQSGDPDYKDMSREQAKADFERRIREYEAVYETIEEPHLSYLRIKNVGSQVTLCHIHGYLQSRIAFYLMNLHLKPRSIYLSRVSVPRFSPRELELTGVVSTEKVSTMWKARSVVTPRCLNKECAMRRLYQHSSPTTLVMPR